MDTSKSPDKRVQYKINMHKLEVQPRDDRAERHSRDLQFELRQPTEHNIVPVPFIISRNNSMTQAVATVNEKESP